MVEVQKDPSVSEWTEVIKPKSSLFDLRLKEVWRYRDLLTMFVKRDFISVYKQTILGPLWMFLQPAMTTITFMVIFGRLAGIKSDNEVPMSVFYLACITIWNYFSDALTKTASVFQANASIFGKVYFPRLIMPLSIVVSGLVRLAIQLILFLMVWGYFWATGDNIHPNIWLLWVPFLILLSAFLSLGLGMIISALTTKYRDLTFLLSFGVQLLMYGTPIIYPMSLVTRSHPKYAWLIKANPLSPIVETFRYAFTGSGEVSVGAIGYAALFTLITFSLGTIVFNKVEKSFMDTV